MVMNVKTEEVNTPETTKEKIIKLSQLAKNHIYMSSGFNSDFYNDPDVKKSMFDAFKRVEVIKLIVEVNAEDNTSKVDWLSNVVKDFKGKLQIKQRGRVPHWLIIDGTHFRLEKEHPIGKVGMKNLVVYDVSTPYISKMLEQKFDEWWTTSSEFK